MVSCVQLVVGLGNPGAQYERTRHNAGFWFVDELARRAGAVFKSEAKFHGAACKARFGPHEVWLLKPSTFMNRSGQAVAGLARFYKIGIEQILVAHDELDLPPGALRLKSGGGHGGHNGLRDIIAHFGSKDFMRLRMGIGHPGQASDVTGYVLGSPPESERRLLEDAVDAAADALPLILDDQSQRAMNQLHSRRLP